MLRALFQTLFRKKRAEQDLDDELAAYLEQTTAENIRSGMTPEAAAQARRDLGGMEQVKEKVRDVRVGVSLEILFQDVRYAMRSLRKNPTFAGDGAMLSGSELVAVGMAGGSESRALTMCSVRNPGATCRRARRLLTVRQLFPLDDLTMQ